MSMLEEELMACTRICAVKDVVLRQWGVPRACQPPG